MDDYLTLNRRRWDELVDIHAASRFYDVPAFLAGRCALLPLEVAEVGDVSGRSLAHLQCHFGLDSLSWARRGAHVTGVDFSPVAVARARELAARAGLSARFVESEVTNAPAALGGETFDVVLTTWGVLCWLPDLRAWAQAVAALVAPGGFFYLADVHPTALLFEGDEHRRSYPYFAREPLVIEAKGSYADRTAQVENRTEVCFLYDLGTVVTSLIEAGLVLDFLREHDAACCEIVPGLIEGEDRMWRLRDGELSLPLSFSLRAHR